MGNTVYEDCSAVPYANSISSVCYQQSEIHDMAAIKSKEGKLHIDKQGSEHSEESVNLRDEIDRRVIYDRNFTDQQLQKLARGRYKCSRCGALKVCIPHFIIDVLPRSETYLETSTSTSARRTFFRYLLPYMICLHFIKIFGIGQVIITIQLSLIANKSNPVTISNIYRENITGSRFDNSKKKIINLF